MEVGEIIEGKVTGITKFGAFVALPEGKSGLVHISEVANAYVSDINEFLQNGQAVKVKVLAIAPDGKINLSIKKAAENAESAAPRRDRTAGDRAPRREGFAPKKDFSQNGSRPAQAPAQRTQPSAPRSAEVYGASDDAGFEDKLAAFLKDSNSKMSGNRLYEQQKRSTRRRK